MTLTPDSLADIWGVTDEETAQQPSLTWRIDTVSGRIKGMIDGEDAIRQFVSKAIATARSRYLIYSDDYGCELDKLIGDDVTTAYLDSEIPRMVREALIYDDRVEDVRDVDYRAENDRLYIEFVVVTNIGDIRTEVVA